ncbi:MAG: fibronectin type III domain-containing protein, partial [Patescibacteria group bacterium]
MNKAKRLLIIALLVISALPNLAQGGNLYIRNINVDILDNHQVKISWNTSQVTRGRVYYGTTTTYTQFTDDTSASSTFHQVILSNLKNEITYHFQVVAATEVERVESFDQSFKTIDWPSNIELTISNIRATYVGGTALTIQWQTTREANSKLEVVTTDDYRLSDFKRARSASNRNQVTEHEVTMTRLKKNTSYYYRVRSKTKDGVERVSAPFTVQTFASDQGDKTDLEINSIAPASSPDPLIEPTTITFLWHTNRPAKGYVQYWPEIKGAKAGKVEEEGWSTYDHSLTIIGLKSSTTYKFEIYARDILGKRVTTSKRYVRTNSLATDQGIVLGVATPLPPTSLNVYNAPRRNLTLEQQRALTLRYYLESVFNKRVPPISRDNWFLLVRAFTYGGYPEFAITQAVKHSGKTVHPTIPWSAW